VLDPFAGSGSTVSVTLSVVDVDSRVTRKGAQLALGEALLVKLTKERIDQGG
jgi:hypothetical protein